jgi:hypothetical protein
MNEPIKIGKISCDLGIFLLSSFCATENTRKDFSERFFLLFIIEKE